MRRKLDVEIANHFLSKNFTAMNLIHLLSYPASKTRKRRILHAGIPLEFEYTATIAHAFLLRNHKIEQEKEKQ